MDRILSTLQRYRTLQPILHTLIAALSTNALTFSYAAISRLTSYEDKMQKAAKVSSEAKRQLDKTRSTQGTAAGTILLSLVSTATLLTLYARHAAPVAIPFVSAILPDSVAPPTVQAVLPLVNIATTGAAWVHVSRFWNGAAKVPVPGLTGYNEAVGATETVVSLLGWLTGLWGVCGVLVMVGQ